MENHQTGDSEDGGEVGGSWTHLLVHPTVIPTQSSEEKSEQPTESQLIGDVPNQMQKKSIWLGAAHI